MRTLSWSIHESILHEDAVQAAFYLQEARFNFSFTCSLSLLFSAQNKQCM